MASSAASERFGAPGARNAGGFTGRACSADRRAANASASEGARVEDADVASTRSCTGAGGAGSDADSVAGAAGAGATGAAAGGGGAGAWAAGRGTGGGAAALTGSALLGSPVRSGSQPSSTSAGNADDPLAPAESVAPTSGRHD